MYPTFARDETDRPESPAGINPRRNKKVMKIQSRPVGRKSMKGERICRNFD
jgi:hypothetical protein